MLISSFYTKLPKGEYVTNIYVSTDLINNEYVAPKNKVCFFSLPAFLRAMFMQVKMAHWRAYVVLIISDAFIKRLTTQQHEKWIGN